MAQINRSGFLAIAIVFHIIYIYSIFDIYFVSPIVSGMREFSVERPAGVEAPAKRLVLIVGSITYAMTGPGDGLRADKAFQSFPDPSPPKGTGSDALKPRPLAPFLRSRVLSHGTFGVSHTRVPTESRPGHVALIAGLYEDVSSVTTGWKLNPVNFDSVFNRSRHTWSWGSPDILPMFKEGAVPGRVDADVYGEELEDYTQEDATQLDTWVFERVQKLFASAAKNATLDTILRQDKNVFFLHLLGLDTTGHAYRPYSQEYLHNIKVVDQGTQHITKLIDDYYGDGKTAFVFTADHGMSDWGSHGDGHPDNTRTPLIAWGAGVAKPVLASKGVPIARGHEDGFSKDWNLDHVQRNDVSQADVAVLMAYLAGLEFPVNSVGELPLTYLSRDLSEKANAALVNAREILEMYRVKEEQKKSVKLKYRPFPAFRDDEHSAEHRCSLIQQLITAEKYEEAISQSIDVMKMGLEGLRYLQTYDWLFLRALVTMGYLGWMAFALTTVVNLHVLHGKIDTLRTMSSNLFFGSLLIAVFSFLWIEQSSWTYYAYAVFPIGFWEEVYARRRSLSAGSKVLFSHIHTTGAHLVLGMKTLAFVGLLQAMVQGYFHREVFSACFVFASVWPAFYGRGFFDQNKLLVISWAMACFVMSTFTLLPVVKVEDVNLILLGGFFMFCVGVLYLVYGKSILAQSKDARGGLASDSADGISQTVLGVQLGLIVLAMVVTKSSVASIQGKKGLPLGNQVVGWLVLVASLTVPFLHSLQPRSYYLHRLVILFLTFSPIFIILTISYEGLFYFAFCTTLVTWVRLEHQIHRHTSSTSYETPPQTQTSPASSADLLTRPVSTITSSLALPLPPAPTHYRSLTLSDCRISLFFLFLLQSAFFSTGNIASLSSFSLDSVYRLIPVFSPFSQGALLILKIMIPFAVISANLGVLNRRLGVAPSALFMVVMAISDVLTLNFFWMVRDEGSWLEIGETISHFCIASLMGVFVAILEAGSEAFVRGVEVGGSGEDRKSSIETAKKENEEKGQDKAKPPTPGKGIVNGKASKA
ncbi:MAG: Glycosyl phosphatidyl inositol anchor synthesis [Sclerophora amabilis]|nr:MAG: Glycosyl phosphatidyl inositol anchor synthesis [Sclerophora amabilis]